LAPEHGKGEVVSFDLEKVLPVVLRATNLYGAVKEQRVEIPQSSDATIISKGLLIIIYGIKIKDRAAVCPITKRPLYLPADNGQSAKTLVQSYKNCIPAFNKKTENSILRLHAAVPPLRVTSLTHRDGAFAWPLVSWWLSIRSNLHDIECHTVCIQPVLNLG
jgi:hypothetical protein